MIRKVRIDYGKPHAPGLFVIRCNAKGVITGENSSLERRQLIHGAQVTKKAPPTTRRKNFEREANTPKQ